eukprot:554113_1
MASTQFKLMALIILLMVYIYTTVNTRAPKSFQSKLNFLLSEQNIKNDITNISDYYFQQLLNDFSLSVRVILNESNYISVALKTIDMVTTKYNHSKVSKQIEAFVNIDNTVDIEQINKKHMECMNHITDSNGTGTYCHFPHFSFIIHNSLGSGTQSSVYNISIQNNNNHSIFYVLKHFNTRTYGQGACNVYTREYKLLLQAKSYMRYYNLSYSSINIPLSISNVPLYKFRKKQCFMFTEQIPNTINMHKLYNEAHNLLPLIIKTKGNVINFLSDCYHDLLAAHNMFY